MMRERSKQGMCVWCCAVARVRTGVALAGTISLLMLLSGGMTDRPPSLLSHAHAQPGDTPSSGAAASSSSNGATRTQAQ